MMDQYAKHNIILIVKNPKENLRRIKNNPTWIASFLILYALVIFLTIALTFSESFKNEMANEIINIQGYIPSDEDMLLALLISRIGALVTVILSYPIALLIVAAIFLLVGKIVNAKAKFKHYFSLALHLSVFTTIGTMINVLAQYIRPTKMTDMSITSLQIFSNGSEPLHTILASFELFTIIYLIFLGIAFQIVAGFSKKAAWLTITVYAILLLILAFIGGMLQQFASLLESIPY